MSECAMSLLLSIAGTPHAVEMIEEGSQPNSPFREILIRQTQ